MIADQLTAARRASGLSGWLARWGSASATALASLAAVAIAALVVIGLSTGIAHAEDPTPSPLPNPPASPVPSMPSSDVPPIVVDPLDPLPPPVEGEPGEGPGVPGGGDDPGMFDFVGKIKQAINGWFKDLVTDALNPILELIGSTMLVTPDVTTRPGIAQAWSTTATVANTAYVLLVVAGGAVVMTHETLHTRYALKDIAPRIVVGFIGINASLSLIGKGIGLANALSLGIMGEGLKPEDTADALSSILLDPLDSNEAIFLILLALVGVVLAVILLITYIIRVVLVILLTAAAPLAMACHALPQTEGAARLWWRAMTGCLTVQIAQSVTLIVALRVFFSPDEGWRALGMSTDGTLVNFLICLCVLYVLIRIPSWVYQRMFAGSPIGGGTMITSLAKTYVMGRALGALNKATKNNKRKPRKPKPPGNGGGPRPAGPAAAGHARVIVPFPKRGRRKGRLPIAASGGESRQRQTARTRSPHSQQSTPPTSSTRRDRSGGGSTPFRAGREPVPRPSRQQPAQPTPPPRKPTRSSRFRKGGSQ